MKKLLMDCDPGHDDMIAIMVACAAEDVDLLGITTVAGNQTGPKTFLNAKKVLTMIGHTDIPVARGADKPLIRELISAEFIHGESGLEGAILPEPEIEGLSISARDFIVNTLLKCNEKVILVATGPLTNIANVLISAPEVHFKIERIVLIGGAINDSNITPGAEFNIFVDPEAAKIVFESGIPLTQVGLDVTNKTLLTYEDIDYITSLKGSVSSFVGPLLKFFADTNKKVFGINGAPVHDALAVATAIWPDIIETKLLNVVIEIKGEYTRGQTVTDIYSVTGRKPNAQVGLQVDVDRMRNIMIQTIKKLDLLTANT
ncbi:MAG: nucleoside hydrolase [Spirochaetales bacterium]|nr:nucleoside hydrolase [Spirochaetales bacterium]